jgi:hypothetical protein
LLLKSSCEKFPPSVAQRLGINQHVFRKRKSVVDEPVGKSRQEIRPYFWWYCCECCIVLCQQSGKSLTRLDKWCREMLRLRPHSGRRHGMSTWKVVGRRKRSRSGATCNRRRWMLRGRQTGSRIHKATRNQKCVTPGLNKRTV